jgi:hypothetical protein
MLLSAGDCGDALHEIEQAFRGPVFLSEHGLDDPGRLELGEAAFAQEFRAVVVRVGNDALPRRLDAATKGPVLELAKLSKAGAAS